ncbi:VOC family protein [Streptomyces coerulescens]|uniref:VOC family protein n=1 Tax=Streptomyces coerulescens TaxID=29304 RepID=A0ABW0CXL3_STRCD
MTGITHLRSIDISVGSPRTLLDFYERTWGLRTVQEVPGSDENAPRIEMRARGPEHHVLALCSGAGSPVRISLGAASAGAVDALAERLRAVGAEPLTGPGPRTAHGGGYAMEFRDPEGRLIEVSAGVEEHTEPMDSPHGPDRLSHIVLNSVDMAASKAFYTDVLGFQVSDWYENEQMVFLRCNEMHHCIVLAPGQWTSLNHVAFEVESADEVMRSLGRMRAAGCDTIWGPGRHGPGGNVFCYFVDPVGNVIEYTAELLEVDDSWVAQEWARTQANADVWGTSGGLTPDVIAAMANPPRSAQAEAERKTQ